MARIEILDVMDLPAVRRLRRDHWSETGNPPAEIIGPDSTEYHHLPEAFLAVLHKERIPYKRLE
jgi:hypothetical protein